MPSIDDLLDAEAVRWRADVDAQFAAATFDLEPPARRPSRRAMWGVSGLGAAAAAAVITLAVTNSPAGNGGATFAGPTPERSAPGGNTSPSGGGGASASCAGPELSFRDPLRHRHVRFTPRLPHPVQAGTSVRIYGAFFLATCNDTGQGVPERPVRSVRLVLHPSSGPRRTMIVAHPSGPLGWFSLSVRIPDNIASGPATITDGYGYGGLSLDIAD